MRKVEGRAVGRKVEGRAGKEGRGEGGWKEDQCIPD